MNDPTQLSIYQLRAVLKLDLAFPAKLKETSSVSFEAMALISGSFESRIQASLLKRSLLNRSATRAI